MPLAIPQVLRLPLCLLLAAATLWLPLSSNTFMHGQASGEQTTGLSTVPPAVMESSSSLLGLPMPERRTASSDTHMAPTIGLLAPATVWPAVRSLSIRAWILARPSLIQLGRLQL